ncbi:hypothetical protein NHX12_009573 [Muraenolepis orangiensis]|uniref:LRRCT domain-containing protein n=1 Tax=Muraenolepis orangiensis TaxID=630683 RepID=A0A9Q0DHW8_9TELE|nr:hypothetical protein NHX12_009573 [Muraenolepis orangiensis]
MGGRLWILYTVFLNQRLVCLAVAALFLRVKADGQDYCPPSCLCTRESGTVTCRDGEDTEVPGDIPEWASTFILRGNNSVAPSAAAAATQLLNALRGAAEHLRSLHRLDLAGNHLKSVPLLGPDMSNLHTLVLTNNSIETIGEDSVSSLSQHKRMRVYLSLNPFRCTCELEAFYYWLRNSSQCLDSGSLLCSEPVAKRGLPLEISLRGGEEEAECANENLQEAVSYVFLGLVLALIGVVFLMVLYLNRGGIKRWLNNFREACRDQMEVYHYRYEQDSDPRLANVAV